MSCRLYALRPWHALSNVTKIRSPRWESQWLAYLLPKFDYHHHYHHHDNLSGALRSTPTLRTRSYKKRPRECAASPSPRSGPVFTKSISEVGCRLNWKLWLGNFDHASRNFTEGVKQCEIWPRFSAPVNFKVLWFRNEATFLKCKRCVGRDGDCPFSSRYLM